MASPNALLHHLFGGLITVRRGYRNVSEMIIALHFFNSEISFGITS